MMNQIALKSYKNPLIVVHFFALTSVITFGSENIEADKILYDSKFEILISGNPFGDYTESLTKTKKGYILKYVLKMKVEGGSRQEELIAFSEDAKQLTPVKFKLNYTEFTEENVKIDKLNDEHWVKGVFKKGKLNVQTRRGARGKEFEREAKGAILSSFIPFYIFKSGNLKSGKVLEFQAIDEQGTVGKFNPVKGSATVGQLGEIDGHDAYRVEIKWGELNTSFWVKPDSSLARMETPSLNLIMKRIK